MLAFLLAIALVSCGRGIRIKDTVVANSEDEIPVDIQRFRDEAKLYPPEPSADAAELFTVVIDFEPDDKISRREKSKIVFQVEQVFADNKQAVRFTTNVIT